MDDLDLLIDNDYREVYDYDRNTPYLVHRNHLNYRGHRGRRPGRNSLWYPGGEPRRRRQYRRSGYARSLGGLAAHGVYGLATGDWTPLYTAGVGYAVDRGLNYFFPSGSSPAYRSSTSRRSLRSYLTNKRYRKAPFTRHKAPLRS